MNQTGRQLLYRVEIRAMQEYGRALARLEGIPTISASHEPFEYIAWHHAITIIYALRNGVRVTKGESRITNHGGQNELRKAVESA